MDFANGFTLWRNLHMTASGEPLRYEALVAIHWTHRIVALVLVGVVAWVALRALKTEGLQKIAYWLLIVITLQFITGVSLIVFHLPLLLAVAHNGGAALAIFFLTLLGYKILYCREDRGVELT
jgi:cytochrome c oxidase assembly protein subunit 15